MTKKRQQDFARVHLKPGRALKRSTLSSVKFKSRKIVMPKERVVKAKSEYTVADYARKLKKATSEKDKSIYLYELNKLIHRQSDNLNTALRDIFDTVLDLMRDPHDDVRNSALKIILYILENTEDLQIRYLAKPLNFHLSALMKSPNPKISTASLVLLDCMVKNHPDLICTDMNILNNLLPTEKVHFTRQPAFEKGTFLYSETEEVNNLGHINTFLKSMLENKRDLTKDEDDKDVYMDESKRMSLVLYTSGGVKPIEIEEVYSKQFSPDVKDLSCRDEIIKRVINSLVSIIPGIFSRIIRCQSRTDDNTLRSESIVDLSILAQVLFHMDEVAERISHTVATEEIATIIKEKVYLPFRKRFPFELLTILPGASLEPLAMLNTSLCFLFTKFLFSNDSSDGDWQLIEKFLKKFFAPDKTYSSEIKCKCIPLFIKMIQLYSYKRSAPDVIFLLLKQLVLLLKTRINHPNKKKLINFLYDMSVLPDYQFWFESEPIELWFNWLFSHLKENTLKLDRKLMKMICKIAKLKHPSFMKLLDFSVIKHLLKHRNEDFKETAIILLSNMDIDSNTLKNVYDIICLDSFPRKFAVTLIRMLNARFHQCSNSDEIYIEYMKFLLNCAVGTYNISRHKFVDLEENKYTKAAKLIQHGHRFTVVPSRYWKEHSQLFQVCQTYLRGLHELAVSVTFGRLVKEILYQRRVVPMHCALAILKLNRDIPEPTERLFCEMMLHLKFSCLMTASVLTHTKIEEDPEWFNWNVNELMNSMLFDRRLVGEILGLLLDGNFSKVDKPDGLIIYYVLRVLNVFYEKRLLDYNCQDTCSSMLQVLTVLSEVCSDKTVKHQPLFQQLLNLFYMSFED